jgi:GT2 family glycosyltransferase/glycosyltransferase involved in cell wall biosynthesis
LRKAAVFLKALVIAIVAAPLVLLAFVAVALWDALRPFRRKQPPRDTMPNVRSASVVIPNWNGKDLLAAYLPSIVKAMEGHAANEILVVDNGSTDGSAAFVKATFPHVRVLELPENLGFGGGSNAGFAAAKNDIVVLLNSDMRVEPDFLQPLLDGFTDEKVFAVSCQIFFSDPDKKREETGLTNGWWSHGHLRVRHVIDPDIQEPYPCYYGGGGSCAFDKRKFFELGAFDHLLRPFYLEDTDLGHMAWKRGWKVLYQPLSKVFHEHRGTIGKHFSDGHIQGVLKKNFLLYTWKNIHEWSKLPGHFTYLWVDIVLTALFGHSHERGSLRGLLRALAQLPECLRARARAQRLAAISDTEVFRRQTGAYFRDRFAVLPPKPERLSVLFVSPYPIFPPIHGGAVFMYQTVRELARLCDVHLIVMLDWDWELEAHQSLNQLVSSVKFIVRPPAKQKRIGSTVPHAIYEFENPDLEWLIQKQTFLKKADVLQLEYTVLGQYAGDFKRLPCILFEHDVYFQSIARGLPFVKNPLKRIQHSWEYLRALKYELQLLPKMDRVQVCSRDNREYIESFLPEMRGRIDDGYRAGIDTSHYTFKPEGREPDTVLFLGSFRHTPNVEALDWFIRNVWPLVLVARPHAQLILIGSDAPPKHSLSPEWKNVELVGFVDDVRTPLARYSVFICPILSGSGVRVKLLEGFAAGIPTVSTTIGAEGLTLEDGAICGLADAPQAFANWVVRLLEDPQLAAEMAVRARAYVEEHRDMRRITERLVACYEHEVSERRRSAQPTPGPPVGALENPL